MDLRLGNMHDVRAFSVAVTAVVLLGNLALQSLVMPAGVVEDVRVSGAVIALALAGPISFFMGLRLYDIHCLTLDLEHAAQHDPLTGAVTRARVYDRAAEIGHVPMTLILADIDRFKEFNDRHGHLAGDAALRQVAQTFLRNCRQEDVVARFGGEEFLILLPGTTPEDGVRVAERLCTRLRDRQVEIDGARLAVTASFGVAGVEEPGGIDAAIARADAALYEAKGAGRDRVCAA